MNAPHNNVYGRPTQPSQHQGIGAPAQQQQRQSAPPSQRGPFSEAFQRLKLHAETLRSQQREPDIDSLAETVSDATAAFKTCMARVNDVEQKINEVMQDPELTRMLQER